MCTCKDGSGSDSDTEVQPPAPPPTNEILHPDTKFFNNVENDVQKILRKEKIQEQYQKVRKTCINIPSIDASERHQHLVL
jgi:hypothetical protein